MSDKKTFVNPTEYWSYYGNFSIELVPNADKSRVPKNSHNSIDNNIVTINNGAINHRSGGIQLYDSRRTQFYWGYHFIKCLRDKDGALLWVNDKHRG
jgi:hypothetical protein